MPIPGARYAHTNIVARDWKKLSEFYQQVFGCQPLFPQRDYQGDWIGDVTRLQNVTIAGIHLRLPGHGENGPTLEIFEYDHQPERTPTAANQPGFAHLAFHVDDIPSARQTVLEFGGGDFGEIHTMNVAGAGVITLVYMTDPEGNLIELQNWKR